MDVMQAMRTTRLPHYDIGDLVGVSRYVIASMVEDGLLPREATAAEMLLAYCLRLQAVASGRVSSHVVVVDRSTPSRLG